MDSQRNLPAGEEQSTPGEAGPKVFISYRRSDTQSAGRQLADALKSKFGAGNVFFDTENLGLGSSWRGEIVDRVRKADAVFALIGPRWVTIADDRGRRRLVDSGEEDVLRLEIEHALQSGTLVVPVLVDDARMPARETLPRPFRPLAGLEAATLRHASWDRDVEDLMSSLEQRLAESRRAPDRPSEDPAPGEERRAVTALAEPQTAGGLPGPDADHYAEVADYFAEGSLVVVLGAGVNAVDRSQPWEAACGLLPNAEELAEALARRFRLGAGHGDLAQVSQHIFLTRGRSDLHRALRELLVTSDCEPGPVHRFLAHVPALLRERGVERFPLIVTTNYDTALERAFDAVHEPFDLAVFMASGEHQGRFFHVPWWDRDALREEEGIAPGPIDDPNGYVYFPIDEAGDLSRTVIVKIHGGVLHDAPRDYQAAHNYLITEDEFIAFLSTSPVQSLVPVQILTKLREGHFLFLEYGVRHWSSRVFLRRIWREQAPDANSWAVQRSLDKVDWGFWEKLDVGRLAAPLPAYVRQLEQQLASPSEASVER
jgi:hypothetical protein